MAHLLSYGWEEFDPARAQALARKSPSALKRGSSGGLVCPLRDHEAHFLRWQEGDPWKGTELHGDPALRFRSTATFVLDNPLDNVIVDHELIAGAIRREWGKADTRRFGHENSEDAVSWNVFRSLQKADALPGLVHQLVGEETAAPILYLWGTEIGETSVAPWQELRQVQGEVECGYGIPTEPDIGLHVPGWGDILIEAKFGSKTARKRSAKSLEKFAEHYGARVPGLLDHDKILMLGYREVPEQLLRNLVYAFKLAEKSGMRGHVIALVREADERDIETLVRGCLNEGAEERVTFSRFTWERIYEELGARTEGLTDLATFFREKSLHLRPAFAVGR